LKQKIKKENKNEPIENVLFDLLYNGSSSRSCAMKKALF
jgi:hypothetical protein